MKNQIALLRKFGSDQFRSDPAWFRLDEGNYGFVVKGVRVLWLRDPDPSATAARGFKWGGLSAVVRLGVTNREGLPVTVEAFLTTSRNSLGFDNEGFSFNDFFRCLGLNKVEHPGESDLEATLGCRGFGRFGCDICRQENGNMFLKNRVRALWAAEQG